MFLSFSSLPVCAYHCSSKTCSSWVRECHFQTVHQRVLEGKASLLSSRRTLLQWRSEDIRERREVSDLKKMRNWKNNTSGLWRRRKVFIHSFMHMYIYHISPLNYHLTKSLAKLHALCETDAWTLRGKYQGPWWSWGCWVWLNERRTVHACLLIISFLPCSYVSIILRNPSCGVQWEGNGW